MLGGEAAGREREGQAGVRYLPQARSLRQQYIPSRGQAPTSPREN
jgi:hypothetical protein